MLAFWLRELRTPELLVEVAAKNPEVAKAEGVRRPAVDAARTGKLGDVAVALEIEERNERERDRDYWVPLKRELETIRLARERRCD
jgi:hypothetical protein